MRFSSVQRKSFVETTDDESRVTRSHRKDGRWAAVHTARDNSWIRIDQIASPGV